MCVLHAWVRICVCVRAEVCLLGGFQAVETTTLNLNRNFSLRFVFCSRDICCYFSMVYLCCFYVRVFFPSHRRALLGHLRLYLVRIRGTEGGSNTLMSPLNINKTDLMPVLFFCLPTPVPQQQNTFLLLLVGEVQFECTEVPPSNLRYLSVYQSQCSIIHKYR